MPGQNKDDKVKHFRLSLVNDQTHAQLWVGRFTRGGLTVALVSAVVGLLLAMFCLVAFTPLRTFIPGYPDAHTQRAAIRNAMRIDSLQRVITRWEFYSENLRRVVEGEDPVRIDSIIRSLPAQDKAEWDAEALRRRDSLLRAEVMETEKFGLSLTQKRNLPIEGIHFFPPVKGVVSQGFDPVIHPAVDITAPGGSVVASVLDGTVVSALWNDESGYTIQIQHHDELISIYKHNEKLLKKSGDKVKAGMPVALVGNTGSLTTGTHLHFELWYKGEAIDPARYISLGTGQ